MFKLIAAPMWPKITLFRFKYDFRALTCVAVFLHSVVATFTPVKELLLPQLFVTLLEYERPIATPKIINVYLNLIKTDQLLFCGFYVSCFYNTDVQCCLYDI